MEPDRWERLWQVFHKALEQPANARAAFLAAACADDPTMHEELDELLRQHEHSRGFLSEPFALAEESLADDASASRLIGERVGGYRLRAVIGEGGMGVVYDAEQEKPVRRRVALKLIKPGMDTREVIARFENERQALALMNHPNIARVLDAGVTEAGRPFFVMEHVAGIALTDYCDQHRVAIAERLALFMTLCQAVEHAHQKGIIHRDLKPSNVLVTMQDGRPAPKVIDFGVAKALHQRLTELTVFTAIGRFIGTPEYMSPEQAESSGLDVDTRTDIYSLGVLLYKLLCGSLPLDSRALTASDCASLRQTLRTRDPRRPSDRKIDDDVATGRGVDREALRRLLRGDLDWIVMRALEKDRTRRYQTASEFADDIRRYLSSQPVIAGPPGTAYRAGKFVRRHRLAVTAAGILAVVVAVFAGVMTVQSVKLTAALVTADLERVRAETVVEFLVELFEKTNPIVARGEEMTVRQALDFGARELAGGLHEQPSVKATLRETIGEVYLALGAYPESIENLADAVELHRRELGEEHPDVAHALALMGRTRATQGKYREAETLYAKALATQRAAFDSDHVDLATTLNEYGFLMTLQGRYAEAEALQLEGLEMRRRLLGERHDDVGLSYNDLGITLRRMNRFDEAERNYRKALSIWREVYGVDNTQIATLQNNLGVLLHVSGHFEAARKAFDEALEIRRKQLGEQHYYTGLTINNLAGVYIETGDFEQAEALYRKALAIHTQAIGADSPESWSTTSNVARSLYEQGDYQSAATLFREVLAGRARLLDPMDPQIASAKTWLARTLVETGNIDAAEQHARDALTQFQQTLDPGHWRVGLAQTTLGRILAVSGRSEEATALLETGIATLRDKRGARARITLRSERYLQDLTELSSAVPRQ